MYKMRLQKRISTTLTLLGLCFLSFGQDSIPETEARWQQVDSLIATLYQGGAYGAVGVLIENAYEKEQNKAVVDNEAMAVFSMWQGIRLMNERKPEEAKTHLQKSVELYRELPPNPSGRFRDALLNLAELQLQDGELDTYFTLTEEAIESISRDTQSQNSLYLSTLLQASEVATTQMMYDKAQQYGRQALKYAQDQYGNQSNEYFQSLHSVGQIYLAQGESRRASNLILQSYELAKKHLPEDHLNRIYFGNSAVGLLKSMGRYSAAEETYGEMLAFFEENPKFKDEIVYPALLDEIGGHYKETGDFDKAYDYANRANILFALRLERNDPSYLKSQIAVGDILLLQKKYTEAEGYYQSALRHAAAIYGNDSWSEALLRGSLATIYQEEGQYDKAVQERLRVKEISELIWGPNHPEYATSLLNLGKVYHELGDTKEAADHLGTAYTKLAQLYGENHIQVFNAAEELAAFHEENDPKTALSYYGKAADFISYYAKNFIPLYAVSDRTTIVRQFDHLMSRFGAFVLTHKEEMPESIATLQSAFLNWKGVEDRPDLATMASKIINPSQELRMQYGEWQSLRQKIIEAQSLTIAEQKGDDISLENLIKEIDAVQKKMLPSFDSRGFTAAMTVGEINRVKSNIALEDALVDFNEILAFDPDNDTYQRNGTYLAFVTAGPTAKTQLVELKLNNNVLNTDQLSNQTSFYEQIWKPIEAIVAEKKKIIISPDGVLNKISFYSIPAGDGKMMLDRYEELVIISNLKSLKSLSDHCNYANALMVGAPDYYAAPMEVGESSSLMLRTTPSEIGTSDARSGQKFTQFSSTATGVLSLGAALAKKKKSVTTLTNKEANKQQLHALLSSSKYPLVHLDLAGFFMEAHDSTASYLRTANLSSAGIALSGAQASWADDSIERKSLDDGLLSALEIFTLDLSGTDLIVLPAISSNLSENGEAIAILKNAFLQAGAKNLIYSLWPLSEKDRATFMTLFYKNSLKNSSISKAFKKTQLKMKKKFDAKYWAGFVLAN